MDKLGNDVLNVIIDFLSGDKKAMASLACVNKKLDFLTHNTKWNYGLFTQHYRRKDNSDIAVLKKEQLTSYHIRAGNRLVLKAVLLLTKGKFSEGTALITQAAHWHASSRAVRILEMLAKIGCCLKKVPHINLQEFIGRYKLREAKVIMSELKKHFGEKCISNYYADVLRVFEHHDYHLQQFLQAFPAFYAEKLTNPQADFDFDPHLSQIIKNNDSTNEISKEEFTKFISKCVFNRPKYENVDADAFLGFSAPKENSWFLQADEKEDKTFQQIAPYLRGSRA